MSSPWFGRTVLSCAAAAVFALFTPGSALGQASAGTVDRRVIDGDASPDLDVPASQSIVPGDLVDHLPVDRASDVVVLQPGVVETITGPGLRGGQPGDEAVLIDGVLTRSFGTGRADNVAVPTNALERVGVTVGPFAAEFGEARSGLVHYVTGTTAAG